LNTIYSRNLFEPFTTTSKGIFSKSERSIAFSGVGQVLDQNNQYLFPILRAEPTTFSFNPEKNSGDISKISGEALTLVSGYQTRNNQRVSISGSLSMCSNDNIYLT
jgi:oligosaccharyltransferase complex subunit beta